MFTVITPATNKKLTTVEAVKLELDITGSAEDAKIGRMIDRMSSMIARYIGVPAASDGSATLALETLAETFETSPWGAGGRKSLVLARRPVVEIVSVIVGTTEIALPDVEVDGAAGMIHRADACSLASGRRTVVTFKAGWTLPPATNWTLPPDIEGAVIGLIRGARYSAERDPAVKAEQTTDIERVEYWVGKIGENGAFPPDIAAMLEPYFYEPVFG